jgi:hypothetical protein
MMEAKEPLYEEHHEKAGKQPEHDRADQIMRGRMIAKID